MERETKAILEQIFDGDTARVLDHLVTMRPFHFTSNELVKILEIPKEKLIDILDHLQDYKLSESFLEGNVRKHRMLENERTNFLVKFLRDIMLGFIDDFKNTKSQTENQS